MKIKRNCTFIKVILCLSVLTYNVTWSQKASTVIKNRALADSLSRQGKYITATLVLKQAIQLIPENQKEEKMLVFYQIGKAFQRSSDMDSARYYYNLAERLYTPSMSDYLKSSRYGNKASLYYGSLEIDSTMIYALKSLDHALLGLNKEQIFEAQMSLGKIFLSQNNYQKALAYYDSASKVADGLNDSLLINRVMVDKGQVALETKKYDQAEKYLTKAFDYFEKKNDVIGMLLSKGHLSKVYMFSGQTDKAVKIGFEILPLMNSLELRGRTQKLVSNTNQISNLAIQENTNDTTLSKAKELYEKNIEETGVPKIRIESNKGLLNYYKSKKRAIDQQNFQDVNQKEVDGKLEQTIKIQDSLYQTSLQSRYTELEVKYKTEQKEKETLQLQQLTTQQELELEKENKRKWLFAIGLITSLIILTIFFYFYRKNQRQKKIIEKLQREIHHRIKNNLAIIDTFIDTAKDGILNKKGRQKLSELQNRIDSIYKVHELLYKTKGEITQVYAKEYIDTLVKGVQQSFSDKPVTILMDIASRVTFEVEQSFPVGLIVNEFLTNSYKYAFKGRNDGKVTISITAQDKYYNVYLSDNGVGLPKDFDTSSLDTFGMGVIKLLTEQLEGSFKLSGTDGVRLHIEFQREKLLP